ncbi:MAG: DUF3617 domain-containing protein [Zoogloeaceae bacterium]|jgi:predicted RNA-binding Zn-ribbon protein involved in translation (DUF1610 family)|nr:DUF3617 domain-containing protein [Zoogloeaceae bacterium]
MSKKQLLLILAVGLLITVPLVLGTVFRDTKPHFQERNQWNDKPVVSTPPHETPHREEKAPIAANDDGEEVLPPPKEELAAPNAMKEVKCDISSTGTTFCPGLWERTMTTGMDTTGMLEQLKSTSSAAYQQAMAEYAKQGIKFTADGKMAFQECVTPEQAKRVGDLIMAPVPQHEECTTITSPLVDKTQKASFTCPDAEGEIIATFQSDTPYTAYTTAIAVNSCGMRVNTQVSYRWLGSDCGNVRTAEDCKSQNSDATSCVFQRGQKRGCN